MVYKKNIKILFFSAWLFVIDVPAIIYSLILLFSKTGLDPGYFAEEYLSVNIYLTALIPIISIYMIHSLTELEYSLLKRFSLILQKYLAAVTFCMSNLVVAAAFILIGAIANHTAPILVCQYILYLICITLAQTVFLSAMGFALGFLLKGKGAYVIAVIISFLFTPFIQLSQSFHTLDNKIAGAFFNLINISFDEPFREKYTSYGMPFNSETVLSWIIVFLTGALILTSVLLCEKCFKFKGNVAAFSSCIAIIVIISVCTNEYFYNSRTVCNYPSSDKADINCVYSDERSPLITRYEMQLKTGNKIQNNCSFEIDINQNDSVTLRLDECFDISNITYNENKIDYTREGDTFTVSLNPDEKTANIAVQYCGRLNYTDLLYNKMDFCDYLGGFLSQMFAWYPKLLSEQNACLEKEYTVEIDSVNSFVTNLDDNILHPAGKSIVSGKAENIYFYIGFIGVTEMSGMKTVMPLSYIKSDARKNIDKMVDQLNNGLYFGYEYKKLFSEYDGPQWGDFKEDNNTLISFEKLNGNLYQWLDRIGANEQQKAEVDEIVFGLKDIWNDQLIGIYENPEEYLPEHQEVDELLYKLGSVFNDSLLADEAITGSIDTIVVMPFSYNMVRGTYIFDNCLIVNELFVKEGA